MYTVHCTLYIVQCTLYIVHCTLYTLNCTHCWAEAPIKIARMTLTIKLDGNWSSFQLANSAPPLSVTDSAIAPSARMHTWRQRHCSMVDWWICWPVDLHTLYKVQCTMYNVQCTVYSVQRTVYSVQCTVYSAPREFPTSQHILCSHCTWRLHAIEVIPSRPFGYDQV